jgi:hypothetical protein
MAPIVPPGGAVAAAGYPLAIGLTVMLRGGNQDHV